jgi:hypothetical protein
MVTLLFNPFIALGAVVCVMLLIVLYLVATDVTAFHCHLKKQGIPTA